MRNKVLGIEVIPKPEDLGGMTIAEASAEFLEGRKYQQYSVAFRHFQECCGDKPLSREGRLCQLTQEHVSPDSAHVR